MNDALTVQLLRNALFRRPELRETLAVHCALLEARAAVTAPTPPSWSPAMAETRLAAGEPLLDMTALTFDWTNLGRGLAAVCAVAAEYRPDEVKIWHGLADLAADSDRLAAAVTDHLARTVHPSRRTTTMSGDGTALLDFALNHVLHPVLSAYAAAWLPLVKEAVWYRPMCPICGGAADFAALLPGGGARRLLCARCDAEWVAPRGVCPFCGEVAPGRLGYFADKDGVYRLYTCETCRRYLKTVDLRELACRVHLPAERILTIGMDMAALAAGYRSQVG